MNSSPIAVFLVDRLAGLIAAALRIGRLSRPVVRLWRLARLRSQVQGSVPVSTQFDGSVTALGTGRINFGANCRLGHGVQLETTEGGTIGVGARVRINTGSLVAANFEVSIGDDTLIGEYVSIRDSNHGTARDRLVRGQAQVGRPIHIGKDVWIGRGCCILNGVSIGDGAVVGANSVVTRDVPRCAIWVGTAAREIGERRDN